MPEAPDLEVVKDFLIDRALGCTIESALVLKPSVIRSLAGDLEPDIAGRTLQGIDRRGKFLLFKLSDDRILTINPKLTGTLQYCDHTSNVFKRTCVQLALNNGKDIRYLDDKQMGQVYYVTVEQLDEVPGLSEQGPDVLDDFSFEEFLLRLRRFPGEIKGVLTRGRVISGIGNAYADEILFEAKVYPFRKRKALTQDELRLIYDKSREVVEEAIPVLKERMADTMHKKVRDFLKVHNKGGLPCPRCGNPISQITANRRITSYCRRCQPGLLIKN